MKEIIKRIGAIIALKKKGGQEMTEIICPQCQNVTPSGKITVHCAGNAKMWGIIQCLVCEREIPFSMFKDHIEKLDIGLPGKRSDHLHASVPQDIQEDVRESERANYTQCYKACVTMCRRAVQLGLIERGIPDKPLGVMLLEAKDVKKLLTDDTYNLATSIKHFGDIGAHRNEKIDPEKATLVIYATVEMLNELF